MIMLLFSILTFAKDLPGEELFVAPQKRPVVETKLEPKLVKRKPTSTPQSAQPDSNLPNVYLTSLTRESTMSELVVPPKGSLEILRSIKVGDTLDLFVEHSVIAFSDEKSPVVATAQTGNFRGYKFIGESYLEKNSQRIFVNFLRVVNGDRVYNFKGSGLSGNGQPGLFGEYHSKEAQYFAGDFLASFASGYFDGLIPRRTNVFGQIESDNSIDSAVKKGLATGSLSTAERFREKLKKSPEFSEIRGPFEIKLLILEKAKTEN